MLPKAILLDLDDTILNDSGDIDHCWKDACFGHRLELGGIDPSALHQAIDKNREWFWSDPERHRIGRLDLNAATREIVTISLAGLGRNAPDVAGKIADMYRRQREAGQQPLPDAVDTVKWLREKGCRLALLTNGNGEVQRNKVLRFGLTDLFDSILIEGELGFGKPDPRIYTRALEDLATAAGDAWMIGDNLEWDVAQPQRMGLSGIWIDVRGKGLPDATPIRPHRILRALWELRKLA